MIAGMKSIAHDELEGLVPALPFTPITLPVRSAHAGAEKPATEV